MLSRMDMLSIARGGLAAAERRFADAAQRVAQAPATDSADLPAAIVDMAQARHHYAANLQVIRFADDMWKSLLEIQVR